MKKLLLLASAAVCMLSASAAVPTIPNATVTRISSVSEMMDGCDYLISFHNILNTEDPFLYLKSDNTTAGANWSELADNYQSAIFTLSAVTATRNEPTLSNLTVTETGSSYFNFKNNDRIINFMATSTTTGTSSTAAGYLLKFYKITNLPAAHANSAEQHAAEVDTEYGFSMISASNANWAHSMTNSATDSTPVIGAFGKSSEYYNSTNVQGNAAITGWTGRRLSPFFIIYRVHYRVKSDSQADYDAAIAAYEAKAVPAPEGNEPGKYTITGLTEAAEAVTDLQEYWDGDEFDFDIFTEKLDAANAATAAVTKTIFPIHSIEGNALVRIAISDGYAAMADNGSVCMHNNKYYLASEASTYGVGVTTDANATETIYILKNNDDHNRAALVNYSTGYAIKTNAQPASSVAENIPADVLFEDRTSSEEGTYSIRITNATGALAWCTVWAKAQSDIPSIRQFSTGTTAGNYLFFNWDVKYVTELTEGVDGQTTVWRAPATVEVISGEAYTLYSDIEGKKIVSAKAGSNVYPAGTTFALKGQVTFKVHNNEVVEGDDLDVNTLGHHQKHVLTLKGGEKYLSTHPIVPLVRSAVAYDASEEGEEVNTADAGAVTMNVVSFDEDTDVEVPAHVAVFKASGEALDNASTFTVKLDAPTPTSLEEIAVGEGSAAVYDLMGRRLAAPVRGAINIINGHKTLVR